MIQPSNRGRVAASPLRPTASPLPNVHGRMPGLDGVRGLAILMVLAVHFIANLLPTTNAVERAIVYVTGYGMYGVDLFFVLSGFLITGILYDAQGKTSYFYNFYMRRFLRIFPLYYGVLVLLFFVAPLIPLLQGPTLDYLRERQAWAWLYGVNIYSAIQGQWSLSFIDHFWSLAVEEQFYVFWPLVVYLLAPRPYALAWVSLSLSLSAMLARLIGSLLGLSLWTTSLLLPFRLDALALGAFLAVAARQPGGLKRLVSALPQMTALVGGLLAATFVWIRLLGKRYGAELATDVRPMLILMLLACVLMWALVASERSVASRFFRSRLMVFLGTYSYGLYVYHHFISYYLMTNNTALKFAPWFGSVGAAAAVLAVLGVSASLIVAYLSYELFEKRFLRLKRLFEGSREARPGGSAAVVRVGVPGLGLD